MVQVFWGLGSALAVVRAEEPGAVGESENEYDFSEVADERVRERGKRKMAEGYRWSSAWVGMRAWWLK